MIVWWFCLRAFVVFETEMVPRPQRPHFFVRRRFSSSTTPWICMLTMLLFGWNTSFCHVTCLMVDVICRVESHEFLYWKTSVADAGALIEKKQNGFIKLSQCRASGAVPAREGFTQQGGRKVYQLSFFFFLRLHLLLGAWLHANMPGKISDPTSISNNTSDFTYAWFIGSQPKCFKTSRCIHVQTR